MCAKIDRARANFAAMHTRLFCPLCGGELQLSENSFVCPNRHCFDLSAANYLNLSPHKSAGNLYGEALFATRRRVFEGGFYDELCRHISDIVRAQTPRPHTPLTVVDAGCGEGFFARRLLSDFPDAEILALDLAKHGVQMAAKSEPRLKCLLADLAALPLADNSVDIILNILSPANYREFARVLTRGGLLIKVIPAAGYLQQVRAAYGLPNGEDSTAAALFSELPAAKSEVRINTTLPLTAEQAADFLQMTPLSDHRTPPTANFCEITIDLRILTAQY